MEKIQKSGRSCGNVMEIEKMKFCHFDVKVMGKLRKVMEKSWKRHGNSKLGFCGHPEHFGGR